MAGFLSKVLTLGEGRQLKAYQGLVEKINGLEEAMKAKSDEELRALTAELKEEFGNGAKLDALLVRAFAAVRESSVRTLGMRHFDVQLIGGMTLNDGQIAEMKTGEGKTLVSTLAGYLNALSGNNVHIVTVNDYLAKRDSEWMGQIYKFLGMDVGLIQNGMLPEKKVPAYLADVTYGTNAEFGFDYLRDNMVTKADSRVQRGHHFAIVDEVDSILIDEARTPLIISGMGTKAAETYQKFAKVIPLLVEHIDFKMDEAKRTIHTTEGGLEKVERLLGIDDLYDDPSGQLANHLQQSLKAQFLWHRDVDYVVIDGEVKIVDEFTGRIMEGRRYSEGLHQALEAKERVTIREENQTLATITLQNYFRLYTKLSGMTGTAMTEDAEFRQIYKLPVMAIPPNRPVARKDENDLIYRDINAKFNAVANDIAERHHAGQPCLVGTVSIESSERLSRLLDKRGIKHEVLNAKHHEREASIIAQAGRVGAVTIATNMAGRGTDILLGGNPDIMMDDFILSEGIELEEATEKEREKALSKAKEITVSEHDHVIAAGGLAVIGTERHESRRIDNQLRGRAGRQGDPGLSQFYLSLEDDLMRLFGGNRMETISNMMARTDIDDDTPIQASMVSKAIEGAQRQVESMNFSMRKNVLEYDDVMNLQRTAIYGERNAILDGKDLAEQIPTIVLESAEAAVNENCPAKTPSDDWDFETLDLWVHNICGLSDFSAAEVDHGEDPGEIIDAICEYLVSVYNNKVEILGEDAIKKLQAQIMLKIIDLRWMAHLQEMDYLKTGISLRAFGQRDPLVEYKNEAYEAFQTLTSSMYEDCLKTLLRLQVAVAPAEEETSSPLNAKLTYSSPEEALSASSMGAAAAAAAAPAMGQPPQASPGKPKTFEKDKDDPYANVGRNDPCPCGSGKKYKKCHGENV